MINEAQMAKIKDTISILPIAISFSIFDTFDILFLDQKLLSFLPFFLVCSFTTILAV